MIDFKPLELKDKDLFYSYLGDYPYNTYEYSFTTLYLWRKLLNIEYAIVKDSLVIKKFHKKIGTYFMEPIGCAEDNLKSVVEELREYKKTAFDTGYLFRDIELPFLKRLINNYGSEISYFEDKDNFDYIYKAEELIRLSGKKFHSKKNHYNQFVKNYNFTARDIFEQGVGTDCINFSNNWFKHKKDNSEQLKYETCGIEDLLKASDKLNILGQAVYVNGKVAGFTIGEKVNSSMAIIHIEKADPSYRGIYTFINRSFAQEYLNDIEFINREEDLGIEGLRKAKLSYNPVKLVEKYMINFK